MTTDRFTTLLTTLAVSTDKLGDKEVAELTQSRMREMLSAARVSRENIAALGMCSDSLKRKILDDRKAAMVESERLFLQSMIAANYPQSTSRLDGRVWTVYLDGESGRER